MSFFKRSVFMVFFGAGLSLILCFAGPKPSMAQNEAATGNGQQKEQTAEQSIQSMMHRMQKIGKRLQTVQQQVMKENPELKKRRENLDALVQKTMDENMAQEGVKMEELKSLQSNLQAKDMAPEKKKQLKSKWEKKINSYQRARMKTMQDKEVTSKRKAYRKDVLAAMEKKEPKTRSMLKELNMLQQQMQYVKQNPGHNQKANPKQGRQQKKGE